MNDDAASLLPDPTPSRRAFLVTTLATGFALSARPAQASTVVTAADGLDCGPVSVPVPGGTSPGYVARPKGKANPPVVLVVQEIFGLHEHIQDVCRRLARDGFMAVSVELYARQGDVTKLTDIQQVLAVVRQVPDAQVLGDLDALVAFAKAQGGDTSKLGITGFCWGGRIVWLYAAHRADLRAGVAWYGRLRGEASALQPTHPLDVVASIKAPVLGLYGAKDTGIPVADVTAMDAALTQAGTPHAFHVYDDAGHAFHADYRPSYVEADAKDGYRRMLAWFREHGVG
ncbi:MAG: dienelactone hydrolase family protein [Alphaproteobacteria bacterium]|nr:dienelactone hydrolase family protein [Alphaproteobacteria bacterium]